MRVLSVLGRCSQLPVFYKFTIVGVFALILIGTSASADHTTRRIVDTLGCLSGVLSGEIEALANALQPRFRPARSIFGSTGINCGAQRTMASQKAFPSVSCSSVPR